MDVMVAISSITQALKTVKDLKDIEVGLDAASYKAKMAELYSTLADVKMALADAREESQEKDKKIKSLESEIESLKSGEICPICRRGRMNIISSKPHPTFGTMGVLERKLKCDNSSCNHTEDHMFNPNQ